MTATKKSYHSWTKLEEKMIKTMTIEEVSEKLGIPISAVRARKIKLSKQPGQGFTSVIPSKEMTPGKKAWRTRKANILKGIKVPTEVSPNTKKGLTFLINGVNIQISGDIKDVLVSKDKININY